ncbi:MAG: carbonic anhydrase [Hyphomicrobium sp.]|nr:carbonic anhydrase [Hyphomicrobium sp.]
MVTVKDEMGVDLDIRDAQEGYQRFRQRFERDRAFYAALASKKQRPKLLWIGCADSRVVPSQITSADPGELFEIRNIANCVPPASAEDSSVGAAIEYALDHLGIDDIVVCGHTGCGGIQALLEPIPPNVEAHLGRWVELTRPAHELIRAARITGNERLMATIAAHIQFQLDNLMTYEIVRRGVDEGRIGLHGWLYDMETAEVVVYDRASGLWSELSAEPAGEGTNVKPG